MALTVTIEGTDVTGKILRAGGAVAIRKGLSNRSTMKFILRQDAQHYEPGEVVYAYWDGEAVFGGKIESVDEELVGQGGTADLFTKIQVSDWTRLLDRFVVAASYSNGESLYAIVENIIKGECAELYFQEGVTLGDVADFTPNKKVNFRYQKVSDCLRDLCKLYGLSWTISPEKVISIRDRSTYAAPWTIGYGVGARMDYRNLQYSLSVDQYRNSQWLIAGKYQTDPLEEKFRGNYTSVEPENRQRTFTLPYPVAENGIISITRAGVVQRLGVRGVDKDGDLTVPSASTWPQWFWEPDSNEISQNSFEDEVNNPTLTNDQVLLVSYRGYAPVVDFEENAAEVAARAAAEGGSGRYYDVEEDTKCDTLEMAQAMSQRYLDQYGRIPRILDFEIDQAGLEPGHLMTIEIPGHGIAATSFMVEDIQCSFLSSLNTMRLRVKAIDGERVDGWPEFWRKAALAGREFGVRENEKIAKAVRAEDTVTIDDNFTVSAAGGVTIPGYKMDPYTCAILGVMTTTVGGEEIPLARFGRSKIGAPAA